MATQRKLSRILTALSVISIAGTTTLAEPIVYEIVGLVTEAENLAFGVLNGSPLFQFPDSDQLPIGFEGTFAVDTANSFAQLQIGGSFSEPGTSVTWDLATPNVAEGIDILDLTGPVQFVDVFDDFDFEIAFSANTGAGAFSFRNPGVVPTSPSEDVFVSGVITSVNAVPTPASFALAGAGLLLAGVRRR
ncbi:MAG: hypothetical protein AAGA55_12605 [Planctomycetota bacterium]